MSHARGFGGRRIGAGALLGALALGALGGTTRAGEPPTPAPAPPPKPSDSAATGPGADGIVGVMADGLSSGNARYRESAQARLAGLSAEQAKAIALELGRRLRPKEPVVRRATSNVGVETELRYVDLTRDAAASLSGRDPAAAQPGPRLLSEAEATRWLEVVTHTEGARTLTAPRITTYDGQRSCTQATTAKAYVADYEREETPRGVIAHPVVRTVVDGMSTGIRATVSADRAFVTLALDMETRQLATPMAEDRLTLPGISTPLVVQRPEVSGVRWSRTVTVASGGSVLVTLPTGFASDDASRDHVLAMLVTSKVVTLDLTPGAPIVDFDAEDAFRVDSLGPPAPIARPPSPAPEPAKTPGAGKDATPAPGR